MIEIDDSQGETKCTDSSTSIFSLLCISATSSEEELEYAYEREMQFLCDTVPTDNCEKELLEHKKEELVNAYNISRYYTMPQRIQGQYEKRAAHAVRLYSFFPVGFFGLIIRLLNEIIGSGGWCDSCLQGCTKSLDSGCCSCSCCRDGECCINDIYDGCFSSTFCSLMTKCSSCYDNAGTFRLIDMILAVIVIISYIISIISGIINDRTIQIRLQRERSKAEQKLTELERAIQDRNELVEKVIEHHHNLKVYQIDVRPFISFLSVLPDVSDRFKSMANRINQPSFLEGISSEYEKMRGLCSEIQSKNEQIKRLSSDLSEESIEMVISDSSRYNTIMQSIDVDLSNNRAYQNAITYRLPWQF